MSIWIPHFTVGWDDDGESAVPDGVLAYRDHWSNWYPKPNEDQPAAVSLSHTPHWCVPGIEDGDVDDAVTGPWARLIVQADWSHDWRGPMIADHASVYLNPDAARALGKALIEWADQEHVEPIEGEQ